MNGGESGGEGIDYAAVFMRAVLRYDTTPNVSTVVVVSRCIYCVCTGSFGAIDGSSENEFGARAYDVRLHPASPARRTPPIPNRSERMPPKM